MSRILPPNDVVYIVHSDHFRFIIVHYEESFEGEALEQHVNIVSNLSFHSIMPVSRNLRTIEQY